MAEYLVTVTQCVRVTLDEAKFTPEFMEEFRESFFHYNTVAEHAEHIGRLHALGAIDASPGLNDFIEGYGRASAMGIEATQTSEETYLLSSSIEGGDLRELLEH